ncbi:MAG: V-type ATP synthase subunit D [Acidobacteriota bacterium]
MARLTLNKSTLQAESRKLTNFRRFLPSLELKRQHLRAERNRARDEEVATRQALDESLAHVGERLPMLANREIRLDGLARVAGVEQDRENVVGVWLPRLQAIDVQIRNYSRLARPHWVDRLAITLRECVELEARLRFAERRLEILNQAVRRITQRVNLFEKVLIPRAEGNIHRLRIYLDDAERAAVVRSKVAQKKRGRA